MSKDYGDFQTPLPLVRKVLQCLLQDDKHWTRFLEPTCGQGNFIQGLLELNLPTPEIQGVEIQDKHVISAQRLINQHISARTTIRQANIFDLNLHTDLQWETDGPLLVFGNPPWVTNAVLGKLESNNVPTKSNFKRLSGFDAMTGMSNFDIAEYIWLKLIKELAPQRPTIALLCKTAVARNILQFAASASLPVANAHIWSIESKKYFNADVDACLFRVEINPQHRYYQADVFSSLDSIVPSTTISIRNGHLVSNAITNQDIAFLDGNCPFIWRQGLKHDAASIFELHYNVHGQLHNRSGEIVQVEQEYVYPFLKSSDLGGKEKERPRKAVLVTQRHISENTCHLEHDAPLLWKYLTKHRNICDNRKSSIYEGKPPFTIFGIGDYSFAPYKVAISGLHKTPKFSAIGPVDDRPVQFDDTCYFIACSSAQQAALLACLLNHPFCIEFIHSIAFWDAKRPITKKLLQRIDLIALSQHLDRQSLLQQATHVIKQLTYTEKIALDWPEHLEDLLKYSPNVPFCSNGNKEVASIKNLMLF